MRQMKSRRLHWEFLSLKNLTEPFFSKLSNSHRGIRTGSSSSDWDSFEVSESVGFSETIEPGDSSSSLDSRLALTRLCKSSSKLFRFSEDIVIFVYDLEVSNVKSAPHQE